EPFQVVLRGDAQNVDDVDVEASDLTGPGGSVISKENVTIYFEPYVDLSKPSSSEGRPGEWPDPLIPRVDRYFGEHRRSFPFKVDANRNQPVWIDLYIPADARPGPYNGRIMVSVGTKREITVPIELTVWKFVLPSTSSMPTSFGFSGIGAVR